MSDEPMTILKPSYDEMVQTAFRQQAEIERLRAGWDKAFNIGIEKQDEIERLRGALMAIERLGWCEGEADHLECRKIARIALTGPNQPETSR